MQNVSCVQKQTKMMEPKAPTAMRLNTVLAYV